jgi:hypothetical protein
VSACVRRPLDAVRPSRRVLKNVVRKEDERVRRVDLVLERVGVEFGVCK